MHPLDRNVSKQAQYLKNCHTNNSKGLNKCMVQTVSLSQWPVPLLFSNENPNLVCFLEEGDAINFSFPGSCIDLPCPFLFFFVLLLRTGREMRWLEWMYPTWTEKIRSIAGMEYQKLWVYTTDSLCLSGTSFTWEKNRIIFCLSWVSQSYLIHGMK